MRRLALAAAAALVLVACYSGDPKPGPNDASTLDFTSRQSVVIDESGIHPEVVRGTVGQAITVTNRGTSDHGITSESIETGMLHPGESTTVFFTQVETVEAHDRTNPTHTVRFEVAASSPSS